MSDLLRLEEPGPRRAAPPSASAFLELGFRPLYAAGCAWAVVAVLLWIWAPQALVGTLSGVLWHAHEMLWGFVATIAVGFLLTAGHNWTGLNPLHGRPLGMLATAWAAARLAYLLPGRGAFLVAAALELVFFTAAAAALARVVVRSRNRRNAGVPVLLLALGVADAGYLFAVWRGDVVQALIGVQTGMLCMAVLALLVARRVIPFFAMRAVAGLVIPMHTRSGQLQLAAGIAAIACTLAGWHEGAALLLAACGALALLHVASWRPWAVRRVPLLWILYAGYAALGAGLLVAAAHAGGVVARFAWPAHVIGMAGFATLVIGMVTRTALGHLGRPLRTDAAMVACYGLVIGAGLLRLAALLPGPWSPAALHASAAAWCAAFGLYLWRFVPMLIRPRVDQPANPTVRPVGVPLRAGGGS